MKYYTNIKSLLCGSLFLFAGSAFFTSCTDWLDKEKEAVIPEGETFKNFNNFQGYVEEIYTLIPNKETVNYCTAWNFGDDAVHNTEGYAHMDHQVDLGNYRNWYTNNQCWLNGSRSSLWRNSWYSIRKCNQGIENIKQLVGTDEERDLLLGQMYFFRAWWHFELMCYFGGLPYIDQTFIDTQIPNVPRLSFQECAERCAKDFQRAYDLLPLNWEETLVGSKNQISNEFDLHVNKFTALCYLGKCYLWAGSPLMKEFEKTKNGGYAQILNGSKGAHPKTYDYDEKYCKLAAEALGQALEMVIHETVKYRLVDYKYDNIYDHTRPDVSDVNKHTEVFYTTKDGWRMPGSTEVIFAGSCPDANSSNWNCAKIFGPKVAGLVDHDNIIHHPTANLIDQYGMANGQPIYLVKDGEYVLNPESGWDPEHPFKDRDPRFYHDIIFDGFHYVVSAQALNDEQKKYEYCNLSSSGAMRSVDNGSSTGYFIQKLVPHQCNEGDRYYDWDYNLQCYVPYMRLADVFLMYAEAQAALATSYTDLKERPEYCSVLSPVEAIDKLRDRVNSDEYPMKRVQPNCLDSREHFLDEVRRERAVELAFEGFRWCDLQRWLLLTEPPYTVKYSHEFERLEDASWYKKNDPKDAKVGNFRKKELIRRNFERKHYWFPFPEKDAYLYEEFPQNPGW